MLLIALLACQDPADDCDCPETPLDSTPVDDSEDSASTDDTAKDTEDSGDTAPVERPLQLYLLGGQSNMDGYAYATGLPPSLQLSQPDVDIFWSGRPGWTGVLPSSYGTAYGVEYFGPEVTFGRKMADGTLDAEVALIKHAIGGTDLAECWYPGEGYQDGLAGVCYQGFIDTVDAALADLEASGTEYEIAGMAWMQGESDAFTEAWALAYEDNLTRFIERVREDVSTPEMRFAMGQIDCPTCTYRDIVRQAQLNVADGSPLVHAVQTDDLPQFTDNIHFDGSGMRTLGDRLARALLSEDVSVATAQPAFVFTGSGSSNYTGDFVVGFEFETADSMLITDLGTLDYGWDGMSYASEVVLWDADTQAILLRGTVPGYSTAPTSIFGGWRFVAVEALELPPGRYVLGSQVYNGSADRYMHNVDVGAADGVSWIQGRHANGTGIQFPTNLSTGEATWFGPNFLFEALP